MSNTALQYKDELARLSAEDRAALAHFLLGTLDVDDEADVEAAWDDEIRRRSAAVDAGTADGLPAPEVFARLREKHA